MNAIDWTIYGDACASHDEQAAREVLERVRRDEATRRSLARVVTSAW